MIVMDLRMPLRMPPKEVSTHGACRDYEDTSVFFSDDKRNRRHARLICSTCPVRQACLEYALEVEEPYGIWGGLDEKERAKVLGQRRPAKLPATKPRRVVDPTLPCEGLGCEASIPLSRASVNLSSTGGRFCSACLQNARKYLAS